MALGENLSTMNNSSLFVIWLATLIINAILTAVFKSENTSWGKYWLVWFFTAVISGLLLFYIISSPESFLSIIESIKNLFSGTS